jgi:hypothetical protein
VTSVSSVSAQDKVDAARIGVDDQCLHVQGAIWVTVSEAAVNDKSLSLGDEAKRIARAHPASGYSRQDIEDALVFAAVDEGVAFDIASSDSMHDPIADFRSLWRGAGRRRTKKGRRRRARSGARTATRATA